MKRSGLNVEHVDILQSSLKGLTLSTDRFIDKNFFPNQRKWSSLQEKRKIYFKKSFII